MIVSLGDFMLDVLVKRRSGSGIEGVVERLSLQPGGSAANVAAWIAYIGVPSGFAGAAGRDLAGDLMVEDLRRRGVQCAVARLADAQTGILLLEAMPDGSNRPAARRGANNLWVPNDKQQQMLSCATWLHLSTYAFYPAVSREPLLAAIAGAHARGVPVSIDLGAPHVMQHIGPDAYRDVLRRATPTVLLANELEAAALAGEGGEPLSALAVYAPLVVLKRGAWGCTVQQDGTRVDEPAAPVAVVDPVGAGDAFVAGFIAALWRGENMRAAAGAGVALGTQCVQMLGGRPPLEWRGEG